MTNDNWTGWKIEIYVNKEERGVQKKKEEKNCAVKTFSFFFNFAQEKV